MSADDGGRLPDLVIVAYVSTSAREPGCVLFVLRRSQGDAALYGSTLQYRTRYETCDVHVSHGGRPPPGTVL